VCAFSWYIGGVIYDNAGTENFKIDECYLLINVLTTGHFVTQNICNHMLGEVT
jgi:hypothetical protein